MCVCVCVCMLIFNISVCSLVETSETHCLQFQTSSVSSRGLKACLTCQSSPTSKQFRAEHFTSEQFFPLPCSYIVFVLRVDRSCHFHVVVSVTLHCRPNLYWPLLCDWVGVGNKSWMISRDFLACCFWCLSVFGCKIGIRKSGWYFMKQRKYFTLKTIYMGIIFFFLNVHKFRQEMKVNQVLKKVWIWIWRNSNTKIQIYKSNTWNTLATNDNPCYWCDPMEGQMSEWKLDAWIYRPENDYLKLVSFCLNLQTLNKKYI